MHAAARRRGIGGILSRPALNWPKGIARAAKWRGQMTIGIGIICESENTILLGSDARGSLGASFPQPHDHMSKIFSLPLNFHAAIAGQLDRCEGLIASITESMQRFADTAPNEIGLDNIRGILQEGRLMDWSFYVDAMLTKHLMVRLKDWKEGPLNNRLYRAGKAVIKMVGYPVHLIVAGFTSYNSMLFTALEREAIEFPQKTAVIGSGWEFAEDILNSRGQNEHMSFQRSVLHLVEALEAARNVTDGTVGPPRDILLIEPKAYRSLPIKHAVISELIQDFKGKDSAPLDDDDTLGEKWKQRLKGILYDPSKPSTSQT
jgi:hypothetical protein